MSLPQCGMLTVAGEISLLGGCGGSLWDRWVPQGTGLALSLLLCPEIQAPVPRPRSQWLPQLHHGPSGEELQPYLQPVSGGSGCSRLRGLQGAVSVCVLVPSLAQVQGNVNIPLGWGTVGSGGLQRAGAVLQKGRLCHRMQLRCAARAVGGDVRNGCWACQVRGHS